MNARSCYEFQASATLSAARKPKPIYKCLKAVPVVTLVLTIKLFAWTVAVLVVQGISIVSFLIFSVQMYLNWFAIIYTRGKFEPLARETVSSTYHTIAVQKVWFCNTCKIDSFYECSHCPLCEVCIVQKDHHCFFLGTCITRHNMKHFIVFCVFAALSCLHTGLTFISWLSLTKPALYFLPVSLGYFISGEVTAATLLTVMVINIVLSTGVLTVCFGLYQVAMVCCAKVPYSSDFERTNSWSFNLLQAFDGPSGLINLIFPITILSHSKLSTNKNV